jgi:dolichol kinase
MMQNRQIENRSLLSRLLLSLLSRPTTLARFVCFHSAKAKRGVSRHAMSRTPSNNSIGSKSIAPRTASSWKFSSDLEDWLWITLPTFNLLYLHLANHVPLFSRDVLLLLGPSAWVCWIQCVLHKVISDRLSPPPRRPTNEESSTRSSAQGNLMGMALLPSLAHAIAMVATPLRSTSGDPSRWVLYAKWTTLSASSCLWVGVDDDDASKHQPVNKMHPPFDRYRRIILHFILNLGITLGLLYDLKATGSVPFLSPWESIRWIVLHGLVSQQHRFFVKQTSKDERREKIHPPTIEFQMATWGEYQILVVLLVTAFMECLSNLLNYSEDLDSTSLSGTDRVDNNTAHMYYPLVAQSGVLGCLLSVVVVAVLLSKQLSLVSKLVLQVAGPLSLVEQCLSIRDYSPTTTPWVPALLPRCLQWLIEFFVSAELSSSSSWPRYWGVLYWGMALVVLAAPTISTVQQRQQQSVVITRKWFHLVAIILFAPITHYFPQLMSLGYAVALCGLLMLEALRREDVPGINDFYRLVQDPTKDTSDGIILSHICLILGCALPLWVAQAMGNSRNGSLLPQWGILCLGVGDAMGAVVGKTYGRIRWGKNQRTVEGSLAMWTSMMLAVGLVAAADQWTPLLIATTFCTLLEAYTIQMDNLVLPLAGSVWIVLFS